MKILMNKTPMNTAIKTLLSVAVCAFVALMINITYPYLLPPFSTDIDFLATKQNVFHLQI
jgi:hypothetical protein